MILVSRVTRISFRAPNNANLSAISGSRKSDAISSIGIVDKKSIEKEPCRYDLAICF